MGGRREPSIVIDPLSGSLSHGAPGRTAFGGGWQSPDEPRRAAPADQAQAFQFRKLAADRRVVPADLSAGSLRVSLTLKELEVLGQRAAQNRPVDADLNRPIRPARQSNA